MRVTILKPPTHITIPEVSRVMFCVIRTTFTTKKERFMFQRSLTEEDAAVNGALLFA